MRFCLYGVVERVVVVVLDIVFFFFHPMNFTLMGGSFLGYGGVIG